MDPSNIDINQLQLSIDAEGNWRHEGVRITHERTWRLFYSVLNIDDQGRYFISVGKEKAFVHVEGTPFIVTALRITEQGIRLRLNDDSHQVLNPETLRFSKENVPYCKIREGKMEARFSRTAYYELAEHIREENGRFVLEFNEEKYLLPV